MKKADQILIGSILFVAILGIFWIWATQIEGAYAVITVDGKTVETLSLQENTTYTLPINETDYNEIVVKDGEIYVIDASCRDYLCMKQGKISKTQERIVCLPNKVIIEVVTEGKGMEENGIDGVVS